MVPVLSTWLEGHAGHAEPQPHAQTSGVGLVELDWIGR